MTKINKVLITGGAGFIGSNLAEHFLSRGSQVIVFDNLSRPGGGARKNIRYLLNKYKGDGKLVFVKGDVSDVVQLLEVTKGVDVIFHTAAKTALTTSIEDPVDDFKTNAWGTLNVLEAARRSKSNPIVIYTSTNKVYGQLTKRPVELVKKAKRWDFAETGCLEGIDETYPLDFEGPYACSKGVGDVYCLDYARIFGLKTVVFRMSSMYGLRQHPTEDQGWVAWFIRCAVEGKPLALFGDGKQVRDILFVEDLVEAFNKAIERIDTTKGKAYNVGGGRANSISILELLELLERKLGIKPSEITFHSYRPADQTIYISNTSKAKSEFGWEPKIGKDEGIQRLYEWMREDKYRGEDAANGEQSDS